MGRTHFAARSCCDLDLQGSDQIVASNTASQYGDNFCEIVLKCDYKQQSYELKQFCCKVML